MLKYFSLDFFKKPKRGLVILVASLGSVAFLGKIVNAATPLRARTVSVSSEKPTVDDLKDFSSSLRKPVSFAKRVGLKENNSPATVYTLTMADPTTVDGYTGPLVREEMVVDTVGSEDKVIINYDMNSNTAVVTKPNNSGGIQTQQSNNQNSSSNQQPQTQPEETQSTTEPQYDPSTGSSNGGDSDTLSLGTRVVIIEAPDDDSNEKEPVLILSGR